MSFCLSQVHIHKDNSSYKKKQSADVWASASSKKQGNVYNNNNNAYTCWQKVAAVSCLQPPARHQT